MEDPEAGYLAVPFVQPMHDEEWMEWLNWADVEAQMPGAAAAAALRLGVCGTVGDPFC